MNAPLPRRLFEQRHAAELAKWYASLSPEDQAFARQHGLHRHLATGILDSSTSETRAGDEYELEEVADPADYHHASCELDPIDEIEPAGPDEFDSLSYAEISGAGEAFDGGLRWSLDGSNLVEMGRRGLVMIAEFRPCLTEGISIESALRSEFTTRVHGDYRAAGILFGRALERVRGGATFSAAGQQLCIVAYVLRPTFINAATLADIGGEKTRQAISKHVNAIRDSYAGVRSRTMRPDITRVLCQNSKLAA